MTSDSLFFEAPFIKEAEAERKKNRKIFLSIGLSLALVIIALVFVFSPLLTGTKDSKAKTETKKTSVVVTSTPKPTEKLTPTPTKKALEKSDLTVEVKNGSGVSGVASKMVAYLRNLGYKISSSGNADNFNYKKVLIRVKESKKDYAELLETDLAKQYEIGNVTTDLPDSTAADASIIIGE